MSVPTSEMIVCAVITSIPSIEVSSTPQIRLSFAYRSMVGSLRRVFGFFCAFPCCGGVSAGASTDLLGLSSVRVGRPAKETLQFPIAFHHLLVRKTVTVHRLPEFK